MLVDGSKVGQLSLSIHQAVLYVEHPKSFVRPNLIWFVVMCYNSSAGRIPGKWERLDNLNGCEVFVRMR